MQEFFEIAKTDFAATFEGAWIFPLLLLSILWILWKEKSWEKKILTAILPLVLLASYWCPVTGMLFTRLLGKNVYWRTLWLILLAVTIPYAACLLLKDLKGIARHIVFAVCMLVLAVGGKKVLSQEWFEVSTNVYKLPQNVIAVCDLLPGNVHAMVSNRIMPYIRQYDPTITLEHGRTSLRFNGQTESEDDSIMLYLEAQKSEIDLSVLLPLAKSEGCTFLVLSNNRTYIGEWEDYGYCHYANTDEFNIYADVDYEEGEDTRKWED